ncbi:MAG: arsenate reductase (glutaredoxin) [Sulfurimonas sp.]|uniref:arsenate reductase (glutaredoxin) n=1 Tax=Sulfurimonas sp. TaxID=2022749 RepID=UPI0025EB32D0|nr:arsenate reductase (glutaredoxin) [Sulfurimonas sp.]MCK9492266.1 arsenate reductase (glutaredoxin) [Sulfurimonas sp.]
MHEVTIWYNPNCSKCREALAILDENECEIVAVEYLKTIPTKDEITTALTMLGMNPRELMRTKEEIYSELDLGAEDDYDNLVDAMIKHPILIERPIIFKDSKAIIGRPTSAIAKFLQG